MEQIIKGLIWVLVVVVAVGLVKGAIPHERGVVANNDDYIIDQYYSGNRSEYILTEYRELMMKGGQE